MELKKWQFGTPMGEQIEEQNANIDRIDTELTEQNANLDEIDANLTEIDTKITEQNANIDAINKDIEAIKKFNTSPNLPSGTDIASIKETGIYTLSGTYTNGWGPGNLYGTLFSFKVGTSGNATFLSIALDGKLYTGAFSAGTIKWIAH